MILERNPDAITQTPLTDTHETVFERAARCSDVAVSRFGECVFNLEVIHDTYANIRFLVMAKTPLPYQSWVTTVLVDSYCAEEFSTRLSIHHADMAFWMVSAVFKIELSYCPNSLLEYRSACIALECARKTSLIISVLRFYRPHAYHPFPLSSSSLAMIILASFLRYLAVAGLVLDRGF
jgi:hypothetical protein